MTAQLTARSISRPVLQRLCQAPWEARVLASFEQACNLLASDGAVLALVTPRVGNGPLNIVVAEETCAWPASGTPAWMSQPFLHIGRDCLDLREARAWEPRPDWPTLRAQAHSIHQKLHKLQHRARPHGSRSALLALLLHTPPHTAPRPSAKALLHLAQDALAPLHAGWQGDLAQLTAGSAQLAGLGGGLTPAGDDFLCGLMLGAWLLHPAPEPLCQRLAQNAAPRTTPLSAALLRAAAAGQCGEPWHALLRALAADTDLAGPLEAVLAHGATSGADALAGFLQSMSWE
ncbi:MAG: DUF2877 domain-containing protein [Chloroflexia bacterium]|nr:DUF2877 domain-containing protein [Chloroflexia bacterium]